MTAAPSRLPVLFHAPYSPWSERARWALDARHLPHHRRTYTPLLGEPALRWRLRRWRGPVSVPALFTEEGPFADSYRIAEYAHRHGHGPALIPPGHEEEVERWNALSERALNAGRTRSLARVREDEGALRELLPHAWRAYLGKAGPGVARWGVDRTRRKYGAEGDLEAALNELRGVLLELRRGLAASPARGPVPTLLPQFSYADITLAQALVYVSPHEGKFVHLGPHSRAAFGEPALASEFADLLDWRDRLYAAHRAPPA